MQILKVQYTTSESSILRIPESAPSIQEEKYIFASSDRKSLFLDILYTDFF